ncbi:MAG: LytTR family DNA-binding domain-containing protein [Gemmatimonadota bacterium]
MNPSSRIRALVVDDEPLVRRGLLRLLASESDVIVAGECRDGEEAVDAIRRERPDLLFLDVQMPGLDGLGVLRALGPERPRAIVFVTAYDRYAIEAFEHHAVDYLLKPFDESRFRTALGRARERLAVPADDRIERLLTRLAPERWVERLPVKLGARVVLVGVDEIDWLEAADNYVRLHAGGGRHLVRDTLRALEEQLDPRRFARIHRSAIVNLARVKELVAQRSGDYAVVLASGERLTLSRSFKRLFEQRLGRPLGP